MDYHDLRDDDNYTQPNVFWNKVLDEGAQDRLVQNLAETIVLADEDVQQRTVEMFDNVDTRMGEKLRTALNVSRTVHL